jgi:hypothetical protein
MYMSHSFCAYNRRSSDFSVGRMFYWRDDPFQIRTLGGTNMEYVQQLSLKFQILTALQLIVISCDSLVYYLSGCLVVLLYKYLYQMTQLERIYQDI